MAELIKDVLEIPEVKPKIPRHVIKTHREMAKIREKIAKLWEKPLVEQKKARKKKLVT